MESGGHKETILVIEDHAEVRENIAEILELSGYQVYQASNGKEGVKAAISNKPDIIICDIMMPEMDGYSVLHILSGREDTRYIPFIFLSAKSEKDDFRKGMNLGADDYLTKPFDDRELLQAIELRLKRSKLSHDISTGNAEESGLISEKKMKEEMDTLWREAERRHLQKKDIIFTEGERMRYFYLLEEGSIKLYKTNEDGKEVVLKLVKPGDIFGFSALLSDLVTKESAATLEHSIVRQIPSADFLTALHHSRNLANLLLRILAENKADTEERLLHMAYNSVRKKIAEALLFVYHKKEKSEDSQPVLHIMRDDLAGIAGTAKETAIRTLADFKEEKLIAIEERNIRLLDIKALENLPN
jgi:CRP/FNR family transcriptional regulator, polysaccharide utilization system transcription regulator